MSEQSTRRGKILIADDTPFFRSFLVSVLGEEGYEIVAAQDGRVALELLKSEPERFELALVDLLMPRLNGFQLLERLREQPQLKNLPVLVLSQYSLNELEREIIRHHRAAILPKSASIEQIVYAVKAALNPADSDNRKQPRAPLNLPLTVRHKDKVFSTHCFNLSERGMFIVLPESESPAEGSQVMLRFWVPGAPDLLESQARVAWVNRPGGFRRNHPPGFGVEFESPSEPLRLAISGYLASHGAA